MWREFAPIGSSPQLTPCERLHGGLPVMRTVWPEALSAIEKSRCGRGRLATWPAAVCLTLRMSWLRPADF